MFRRFWSSGRIEARSLDGYWDDVVRRSPATPMPPEAIPGDLGLSVRKLHELDSHVSPRPQFEEALLTSLLARHQEMNMSATLSHVTTPPSHRPIRARSLGHGQITAPVPAPGHETRWWRPAGALGLMPV